ncbi:aldose 1-epimerase [Spirosoma sp. KUDC1026]|uniref:aldose 1-epimerase n=1 Tax=Spirosoma sp. KUDC1026 TaxID=2745947 RepID=UPI00159BA511|nr:aldose 1-epimerase [Spirosoma sp. KUDC1026]QKZ12524.1 aldose 1-epimerase [Spirosoma sp. KUDC1026]
MPFQITTQPFGPLPSATEPITEYILEHTESGEFITVLPGFGATLRRLVLRKGDKLFALLKTPESPQALVADETHASALLYPFVSRIRHGIYMFEDESYTLKLNEASRDNAIHGFVYDKEFTVVEQEATDTSARLTMQYDYKGEFSGYPFPFLLTITYELVQADLLKLGSAHEEDKMSALRISYSVRNTGPTRCPAAFGWHPYFMFSEEPIDNHLLELPGRTEISLDAKTMLPTGHYDRVAAERLDLYDNVLDTPFMIEPTGQHPDSSTFAETSLISAKHNIRLVMGQETGEGKLNYMVCFTPPKRDSIAIEPLTSNVNAFNNGEGLTVLHPGGDLSGNIWVRLD